MSAGPGMITRETYRVGPASLSVLTGGPEDGDVMLFLHGIPASAELWRGVMIRAASSGYRVYAPDLPGYGYTSVPKQADFSLLGASGLLAAWLDDQGLQKIWLIGHDIGGGVAQLLALARPRRFTSLTFSNAIIGDSWPVRPILAFTLFARLRLYAPLAAIGLIPHNPYVAWEFSHAVSDKRALTPEIRKRVFWDSKANDVEGRNAFQRHLLALDNSDTLAVEVRLKTINIPVQLIWGMQDPHQSWERAGKRYLEAFPQAAVTRIEDAGHFLQLEKEAEYWDALMGG